MAWVGFRREELTCTGPGGEPTWYAFWPTLHHGFCPRCGTHLASVADNSAMIFRLLEQNGLEPLAHSFRHVAVPWMTTTLATARGLQIAD
ncbi:aldehyde-activating protein [Streptomyces sp. NPDC051366]|uniref:aldehyde-activating protein n=1 Tax=Streptomyces sp. NPDC051366 TaxID=3365652 RepID=UPI003799C87A